ncbi:MAG: glycosyl transferase [Deltaproteobacteria bacterium HGW-Deltaproteobacteria-11]|nr:MAG: glycosyl transferase [Deltaproteobacteria bacterium HGW-Deltaproteobacteria-11]
MNGITVIVTYQGQSRFERVQQALLRSPFVRKIFVVHPGGFKSTQSLCKSFEAPSICEGQLWNRLIGQVRTGYLLLIQDCAEIEWGPGALERLIDAAETTKAGMIYSDYYELQAGRRLEHPVNDYQPGSIRDDFNFGPVRLISVAAVRSSLKKYGAIADLSHAGLYDLRLKVSTDYPLFHLQEYLYTKMAGTNGPLPAHDSGKREGRPVSEEKHFAYVDPRHQAVQREMEAAATAHLKRIGAWMKPAFKDIPAPGLRFPVEASVIIPVRNRRRTVADAVHSALSQKTDFAFNVICVDNHSTDGTTKVLSGLARKFPVLKHLIPQRTDLGIGGCWNEAIFADCCGRISVQLDSDDLYSGPHTVQKIVDLFRSSPCAMVIGAYTLVDEHLETIPPGLIDHREWTDDNGRNNAVRINGLGAPRAFRTALVRQTGFLNVSYGEDYAMVLRLLREYRLGRIYENLYLCRRWEGNTDADLPVEKANRNDAFKDKIRTLEIMARQTLNRT